MDSAPQALVSAADFYLAGRLTEAEQLCRQVLDADPACAKAWRLLGVIAAQAGKHESAAELLERAIQLEPDAAPSHRAMGAAQHSLGKLCQAEVALRRAAELNPAYAEAHLSLANVLQDQDKRDEAIAHYRRAIELKPNYAAAHTSLGAALASRGKLDEAIAHYRRAIELEPTSAQAYNNLGAALVECAKTGRQSAVSFPNGYSNRDASSGNAILNEAVNFWQRALALKPDFVEAYVNLGNALRVAKRADEATKYLQRALDLRPNYAHAYSALGLALLEQDKLDEAEAANARALELAPELPEIHNNLALALREQDKLVEAAASSKRALALNPNFAEGWSTLAICQAEQGQFADAAASYQRAVELQPDAPQARFNEAMLILLTGDFRRGWPGFELRWCRENFLANPFGNKTWRGQDPAGKTMLVHAEQGLGDTLQFIRYAALVQKLGTKVIVQCQDVLLPLLRSFRGINESIGVHDAPPPCDYDVLLMSLPGIFQTTVETIPSDVPYLFADSHLINEWRNRLADVRGFRIGINWHGRAWTRQNVRRDFPVEQFSSLAKIPGVQLISLQKDAGKGDVAAARRSFEVIDLGEFDTTHGAFIDTAAVMMNLDLVITSDTSIAHVAGALGVPVWVALPMVPDWRWLLDRSDSPWYPTMRLFRQKKFGDWAGVFEQIRVALVQKLAES
jgi:tetratricopeptide (TPR) repeat protein